MNHPAAICLITPGHVASTPRLAKSAEALSEAGYQVHVVAGAPFPPADPLDAEIISGAKWTHIRINTRSGPAVFARKLLRRAARRIVPGLPLRSLRLAALAHSAEAEHLAQAASRVGADLYIGHCVAGLYAAARAAAISRAAYGFDIEDYHDAETEEAMRDPIEVRSRALLQSRLLPSCRPLTCAAPMISARYKEAYGVEAATVLNVFPLSERPAAPKPIRPFSTDSPAIFYWFSQTIGPGRGLERFIGLMSHLRTPSELHLRGFVAPGYAEQLQARARASGLRRPISFLRPASPREMARLASEADFGLSLEEGRPLNKDICLANKVFVYLLAGIPQVLSNTAAQSKLATELGVAALVCDLDNKMEHAARIDAILGDPAVLGRANSVARELAERRFCWDVEKLVLVGEVQKALLKKP